MVDRRIAPYFLILFLLDLSKTQAQPQHIVKVNGVREENQQNMHSNLNINTRFGMLKNHPALTVTISEEKQVYDTLLKLILVRVNGKLSLHVLL